MIDTDILSFATKQRHAITEELHRVTKLTRKEVMRQTPQLSNAYDLFVERLFGGKMFRPVLVQMGYCITGANSNPESLKIAAAMELLHNSLVIHDDIIDKSSVRRGKTSLYYALGNNHYAISQAMCLGDIGFFLANKLITEARFPAEKILQCQAKINQTIILTALGEMLDMEVATMEKAKNHTDVVTIHTLKTAYYSVATPLALGALLANGTPELIAQIEKLGVQLGIMFQIRDDVLGIFGDEERIGKSTTSDSEEGKNTLLIVHARKYANREQKAYLEKYYGKGSITPQIHQKLKEIFIATGAREDSEKKIVSCVRKSSQLIKTMKITPDKKELLISLMHYLEKRDY